MNRGISVLFIFVLVSMPVARSSAIPQGSPLGQFQSATGKLNGTAVTECPNQEVYLTTSISRHGWWIFPDSKSVSKKGFQKVMVNVSLPCKWKRGDPPILYVVKSSHRDAAGASAPTGRSEKLYC